MHKQIEILSIPIDAVTMNEAVNMVLEMIKAPKFHMVSTANAEMLMMATHHEGLREVLQSSDLVVPDGAGALWAAEQQGEKFPERVAGYDLVVQLMKEAAQKQIPVYILGAAEGVAKKAIDKLEAWYGPMNIAGYHSGFFDEAEEAKIISEIESSGAQIVLVALGVPKQELWAYHKLQGLKHVVGIGVGGSLDVLAGTVKRAPLWFQEHRLEWLYRLCHQPSRFKRMLALPKFMWTVKTYRK